MQCTLELYLKGSFIISEEVLLHDIDRLTWEENCKIRELELKAAIEKIKINHVRAILKSENRYEIVAVFKSRI